jgi:hypothetical protein
MKIVLIEGKKVIYSLKEPCDVGEDEESRRRKSLFFN